MAQVKAPDKIYLQCCGDCPQTDCDGCKFEDLEDNVTWCKDRIFDRDVEYIRKDAIMALLDAEKEKTSIGLNEWENGVEHGRMEVITSLTEKIKEL